MSFNRMLTIGDIAKVFDGPHATPKKIESGPYFLSISSLENGKLDLSKSAHLSDEDFAKWTRRVTPEAGDILFSYETRLGEVAMMPSGITACLGRRMGLLRPDRTKILPEYLLYAYQSNAFQEIIRAKTIHGATVDRIALKELPSFPIQVPTLIEQQMIVDILRGYDRKLILNSELTQTLEEMAQAIFKSWFVDFDPVKAKMNGEQPEGMDAATASLFPEKLVESELGLTPEGWPVDQVGNHIDVTKGVSYKSAELQESTTALVTLKSFKRGGGYRMDGLKEYTGKYKSQQVIEAGDLVMSLTDVTQAAEIVGKPALVINAPQYDTLVASLDVAILRPKETDAKQYFYGLMSTYRFHRYAESFATGTTVLHLSPKGIPTFEFACPTAKLIKKYNEFAEPIFAKIEANILESQELANLRDTLLPKLLSGEIELAETTI